MVTSATKLLLLQLNVRPVYLFFKKVNNEQLDTYKIKLLRGCFVGRRKKYAQDMIIKNYTFFGKIEAPHL